MAGSIQGQMYIPTRFLVAGVSLHPLQRVGAVAFSGAPVQPAGQAPGMQSAPWLKPTPLGNPPMFTPSIPASLMPYVHF
jgi:hypothetical protein